MSRPDFPVSIVVSQGVQRLGVLFGRPIAAFGQGHVPKVCMYLLSKSHAARLQRLYVKIRLSYGMDM